nr:hypothetical protein [uncultured bacterium]
MRTHAPWFRLGSCTDFYSYVIEVFLLNECGTCSSHCPSMLRNSVVYLRRKPKKATKI